MAQNWVRPHRAYRCPAGTINLRHWAVSSSTALAASGWSLEIRLSIASSSSTTFALLVNGPAWAPSRWHIFSVCRESAIRYSACVVLTFQVPEAWNAARLIAPQPSTSQYSNITGDLWTRPSAGAVMLLDFIKLIETGKADCSAYDVIYAHAQARLPKSITSCAAASCAGARASIWPRICSRSTTRTRSCASCSEAGAHGVRALTSDWRVKGTRQTATWGCSPSGAWQG